MKTGAKEIKTIFDWLEQITFEKREWNSFTENEKETWNSYMIHRFVSMYYGYIDIANIAQKLPLTEKEKIYTIYKTMLPKKKLFLKYVKNQNKKSYNELAEYVAEYFVCSLGEAEHYIDILREAGVRGILHEMGIQEKEAEKIIKKAKL